MINIVVDVNEIIKEEESALIHKQDIPDSGIKTQHQFFWKAQLGANYEVRDLIGVIVLDLPWLTY